ncbi:MAG: hypothetical protein BGO67_04150 [Alphaproteobacteria bacterium 41-28]|nr:MAG: hypothetical protein BGO67_04150 [Alphaproteobacteria bacterium 41-28]
MLLLVLIARLFEGLPLLKWLFLTLTFFLTRRGRFSKFAFLLTIFSAFLRAILSCRVSRRRILPWDGSLSLTTIFA